VPSPGGSHDGYPLDPGGKQLRCGSTFPEEQQMPTAANIQTGAASTGARTIRIAGFVFGMFVMLAGGGVISVAFSGNGLSSSPTPPEQIYFP
jgi:hypothetical protein